MSNLINRQDAIEAICEEIMSRFDVGITEGYELVEDALSGLPSAEPLLDWQKIVLTYLLPSVQPERKKGKWILDENPHDGDCRCSVCLMAIDQMHEKNHGLLNALTGGKWWTFYNFCPNCGADMREGEQSDPD